MLQHLGEARGLDLVEARGRLVEEQHLRLGGQRPAELDQAGLPGGQRVGPAVGDRPEAEELDDPVGDRARRRASPCRRLRPAISAAVRMLSSAVIEPNTSSRWNVRFMPEAGPAVRRRLGDVDAVEVDRAAAALHARRWR